jgi:hypothetical protein
MVSLACIMSIVEEEFEKIAQEASEKAASVSCSVADYQDGLRGIIETLQVDIQASKETE